MALFSNFSNYKSSFCLNDIKQAMNKFYSESKKTTNVSNVSDKSYYAWLNSLNYNYSLPKYGYNSTFFKYLDCSFGSFVGNYDSLVISTDTESITLSCPQSTENHELHSTTIATGLCIIFKDDRIRLYIIPLNDKYDGLILGDDYQDQFILSESIDLFLYYDVRNNEYDPYARIRKIISELSFFHDKI